MQLTRKHIVEILRIHSAATVEQITEQLSARLQQSVSAVTVRHHLDTLRVQELVTQPTLRHSGTRGRPQLVYSLTPKALDALPNNYQGLADAMIQRLKNTLPPAEVNVFFEALADNMAVQAHGTISDYAQLPVDSRLSLAVEYLNTHGYDAEWLPTQLDGESGYHLFTHNCPYHRLVQDNPELCAMDMRLIAAIIGVAPRLIGRLAEGHESCEYFIPARSDTAQAVP